MDNTLLCVSLALMAGLLSSRLAKRLHLPAVTGYLITGLLLGPFFLGRLNLPGFGFNSEAQLEGLGLLSDAALGFIAFTIGNEFRLSELKHMGRQAVTVGILQAVLTTAVVDLALVGVHFVNPELMSLPAAITLGAIAAATAPAATLMVVRQYRADGPLTRLLLMVVAIDDAVGLVLFSVSFGVARALEVGSVSVLSIVVEPLVEIVLSLVVGVLAGLVLTWSELYFHSPGNRMSVTVAFVLLTVGVSAAKFDIGSIHFGFSLLLVCMMTGTVFCNTCLTSEDLMAQLDRWTAPLTTLFFVLSGAELNLDILRDPLVLLVGVVYILARSLGKISGSYISCAATNCSDTIKKNLGITLLPQAGVALGMTVTAASLGGGALIRNVVLFAVLIYELFGPMLTRRSLVAAGEIDSRALAHADAHAEAVRKDRRHKHREHHRRRWELWKANRGKA